MRLSTRFITSLILSWMALTSLVSAQSRFIPLNVDYADFRTTAGESYVEIYLSFLKTSLQYVDSDSLLTARFSAHFDIYRGEEAEIRHTQHFISRVEDVNRLAGQEFRHVFPVKLEPGNYRLNVIVADLNSAATGEYERDITIATADTVNPVVSGIELAVKIAQADGNGAFVKNGLQVVPNPSGVYHVTLPMLYYYCEAYNLPFDENSPAYYKLESYLTNPDGEIVRTFPAKRQKKTASSAVLVGGSNIVTLPSGTYFLNLSFTDEQSGRKILQSKRFTLFKPTKEQLAEVKEISKVSNKLMLAYYSHRSEEEMDTEFDQAHYIATNMEKEVFATLDKQAKAEFLVEFWQKRDPDLSTPQNEYKAHYFELVRFCIDHFRSKFREGWRTDRGRVLLTYGQPNDVERGPSVQGSKPYEIWQYDQLEGGSEFIFGDLRGFGEYELLHSTYSKELSQPDWKRLILRSRDNREIQEDTRF